MNNNKLLFLLLLYLFVLLSPTYFIPVFETTEARYSEISWEMIHHNDFIEPRYNGIKHFHKPPLTYWINALGIKIFGVNGFSVRFFGVLAAVLTVFFTVKTARLLDFSEKEQEDTFYILISCLLFLVVSRIVSTDIYLTFFTVGALYFLFRQMFYRKSTLNVSLLSLFLGLGFLTKGPIIFLFTLLPYFLNKIFSKTHRQNFTLKEILAGSVIFTSVALPWYIVVIIKNPELLNYFLKVQTVDRVVTNRFHRYQPFYFFIFVFAGTFFPYIICLFVNIFKDMKNRLNNLWLYTYLFIPFIVFSIAQSKLATYILPFFPIASILASKSADFLFEKRIVRIPVVFLMGALPFTFLILPFIYKDLFNFWYLPAGFFILSALIFYIFYKNQTLKIMSFYIVFLITLGYFTTPIIGKYINGYLEMASYMNKTDAERKIPFISYHADIPSISFYRQKIAVIAMGRHREIDFEKTSDYKEYYLKNFEEFRTFTLDKSKLFVVLSKKYLEDVTNLGFSCEERFTQKKYSLFLCTKSQ